MEEPLDKTWSQHEEPEAKPPVFYVSPNYPHAQLVLVTQVFFSALFSMAAGALFMLIALLCAWDIEQVRTGDPSMLWPLRLMLGMSHLFMFTLAGWATLRLYYRGEVSSNPHWLDYLEARSRPAWMALGLGALLMLTAFPLVLYVQELSKWLPMSDLLKDWESGSQESLKILLSMETPLDFLANLLLIAFLAALGEELIFRGVLQKQLMRVLRSPWMAIVVSAMIFSAIHLQFEGFFSRWLLGLLLGWLYWFTGNFWVPVFAHFFFNGVQIAGQYAYVLGISDFDLAEAASVPWQFALISAFCMAVVIRLIYQSKTGFGRAPRL